MQQQLPVSRSSEKLNHSGASLDETCSCKTVCVNLHGIYTTFPFIPCTPILLLVVSFSTQPLGIRTLPDYEHPKERPNLLNLSSKSTKEAPRALIGWSSSCMYSYVVQFVLVEEMWMHVDSLSS